MFSKKFVMQKSKSQQMGYPLNNPRCTIKNWKI